VVAQSGDYAASQVTNAASVVAANVFTAPAGQTMPRLVLSGSVAGTLTLQAPAQAGSAALTWPAGTTDFSVTGGPGQVVRQQTVGGPLTVAPLSLADVSGSSTVCTSTTLCTGYQAALGYTPENVSNKATGPLSASTVLYPTAGAVKAYVDAGLATKQDSLGFAAEDVANKSANVALGTSAVLYPTQSAVKAYVDTGLATKQPSFLFGPGLALTAGTASVLSTATDFLQNGGTTDLPSGTSHRGSMQVMASGEFQYIDGGATGQLRSGLPTQSGLTWNVTAASCLTDPNGGKLTLTPSLEIVCAFDAGTAGGGGGAVASVFGRTGAVIAQSGDYTAAQVTNAADRTAANVFTHPTGQRLWAVILPGLTSGTLTLRAGAVAGSSMLTLPAGTTDFTVTGGPSQVLRQSVAGGPFLVSRLAVSDLSDGTAVCTSAGICTGYQATLTWGAGLQYTAGTASVLSTAAGFLRSGGAALVGGAGQSGKLQVLSTGELQYTDGNTPAGVQTGLLTPSGLGWAVTPTACTGDANGGKLTVNALNKIVCASDVVGTVTTSVGAAGTLQMATGTGSFAAYLGNACPAGQIATAVSATGVLTCFTPPSSTLSTGGVTMGAATATNQVPVTTSTSAATWQRLGIGAAGTLQATDGAGLFAAFGGAVCAPGTFATGQTSTGALTCQAPSFFPLASRALLTTPNSEFPNGVNLGALPTGLLQTTPTSGVAALTSVPLPSGALMGTTQPQVVDQTLVIPRSNPLPDPSTTGGLLTPNPGSYDVESASSVTVPFTIQNPTGTIRPQQRYTLRLSSLIPQAITWSPQYSPRGLPLPPTTTGNGKDDQFDFIYDAATGQLQLVHNVQLAALSGTGGGGTGPLLTLAGLPGDVQVNGGSGLLARGPAYDRPTKTLFPQATKAGAGAGMLELKDPHGFTYRLMVPNLTKNRLGTLPDADGPLGVGTSGLTVQEVDGSPTGTFTTLKFSNGSMTNNGDGSATIVTGAGGGGDASTNTSVSVDGETALFAGTGGKTFKRDTLTATVVKSTAGIKSAAIAGTDYVIPSGNVATATALAADGANCSAGQFPLGVDASGAVQSCTALPTAIAGTANQVTASAATGAVTLSLPQNIDTAAAAQFGRLGLGVAAPSTAGQLAQTGGANNLTLMLLKRNTDAAPTGKFTDYQTAAGASLWSVDITGSLSVGTIPGARVSGNITGQAATAAALAADPSDCGANTYATAIAANGNLTCGQVSLTAGISGLGTGVATFLATPSSANLATAVTDETGSGLLVFGTSPTIVTPTIASFANAGHTHTTAAGGGQLTDAALSSPVTIAKGGTGTASTLTGLVRGSASAMTAAELSGDCTTAGSNAVTCTKLNGGTFSGTNGNLVKFGASNVPADTGIATTTMQRRTCIITIGRTVGPALGDTDLPENEECTIPTNGQIEEIEVSADTGTPSVAVHRRASGTNTALLSTALATGGSGAAACARPTAVAGFRGTTCSATLQNTTWTGLVDLGITSGTAGGAAHRVIVRIHYLLTS